MNNTNNALETLVQRDKQIKKANDKLKAELETTTNALSTHASNTDIHTSKEELIQLIVDHLETLDLGITKEVVSVLPTENISDNTLYFVPNEKGYHNEYLYINDKWELVGSTETNFTDYYTKLETNTLLEGKANSIHSHVVSDITDFPTIPTKLSQLENDMGFGSGSGSVITSVSWSDITDKPNFATVATSGSYNDLSNKPTIPNVYNKTLTIQKNGTNVATFTSNSNTDVTADITVPTKVSELSNDSGFITGISWDKVTNKPTLATVAISGSYTDLSNTPTIPTKVSQLENDTGFINALTDVVDTKSNQTINGIKTFTQTVNIKNNNFDLTETPTNNVFSTITFRDKNNTTTASLQNSQRTYGVNDICFYVYDNSSKSYGFRIRTDKILEPIENNSYSLGSSSCKWANAHVTYTYTNRVTTYSITHPTDDSYFFMSGGTDYNKGATLYLGGVSATNFTPGRFALAARKTDGSYIELAGSPDGILSWGGKNVAIDENLVHKSGNETIEGNKTFSNKIKGNLQGNADTATKASYLDNYSLPGGNKIYLDWDKQVKSYVGLKVDKTTMGGLITTKNIGSQAANSATYSTTPATTDNSTRIATTAWVRNYVNSVAGSGGNTIGSSISAYWSTGSNVTSTQQDSNERNYPECYSNYIDRTPGVGIIYSGAQLYSELNAYANATRELGGSVQNRRYITKVTAQATFSNPISSTGKYLCTTANTVSFRAYAPEGKSAASVIDYSATKSIFIRVE